MKFRNFKTVFDRRKALEKELKIKLPHIGSFTLDEKIASDRNCENMIGVAQLPLGIAGPVKVKRLKLEVQNYYIPLATTEGALVASVNRGCKAITQSGGATVDSYKVGSTRGPVFKVKGLAENDRLNSYLEKNITLLQKIAASTSNHLKLKNIFSRGLGRYRYVRFVFDTADAMGMNMATIAAEKLCRFIEKETGANCISVAGNYDTDKKPSWLNAIEGRGYKVWAEALIPGEIVKNILKTTPQRLYEVWLSKCMIGSAMSGSMAFNAHYANILSAIFIACGQDPAHVAECSVGVTTAELVTNNQLTNSPINQFCDLYISIYLPDLMMGTVGGGTGLSTQKEALSILGVAGGDKTDISSKLAQITGAAVLAGELSLLSSLAEGSLARAHEKLGRG